MKAQIAGINVMLPHNCTNCGVGLSEDGSNFPTNQNRYRSMCRKCFNHYTDQRKKLRPGYKQRCKRRVRKVLEERAANSITSVLSDAKRSDRRHNRLCTLDLAFVERLIEQGCFYCTATKATIRIGLDRIDNTLGHTKDNVNPCCTICNLTRGNMPYPAWLIVVEKGMKAAQAEGAFETWVPGNRRKRVNQILQESLESPNGEYYSDDDYDADSR